MNARKVMKLCNAQFTKLSDYEVDVRVQNVLKDLHTVCARHVDTNVLLVALQLQLFNVASIHVKEHGYNPTLTKRDKDGNKLSEK